jgi:flagellar hook-basal body complex protein FliE
MAQQAKVTSLDALERFRAHLIEFLSRARTCVAEVTDEVRRTRQWLEHDQRTYWEAQMRVRRRKLDQAEGELFSARLSKMQDDVSRQQAAVRKAREAMVEAEEKLRAVKKWTRNYDSTVDPPKKGLEHLKDVLDHDLPHAVTFLVQAQRSLDAYANTQLGPVAPTPLPAAPEEVI